MKITPEEALRMARKAEAIEAEAEKEGINPSVLAGRPPQLRLRELALEHERRQARLRWTTIASICAAIAAIVFFLETGAVLMVVAAGVFLLTALAFQIAAGRSARSFKASVGEPTRLPLSRVTA